MSADPFAPPALAGSSPVAEYHATEQGLADLRHRLANIVHDCTTTKGMDAARKDRRECVTLRTALEAIREEKKAPILERGRLLDAEAKRIASEIEALEKPIDEQIKRVEKQKADAKAAAEKAEADRVALIQKRLNWIRNRAVELVGKPAADISAAIVQLGALTIDETGYGIFLGEAQSARQVVAGQLELMHAERVAADAAAVSLALERGRLAEEKRAHDERVAADDAARAAEQKRQDDARAYDIAWDDAHRLNVQRDEDCARAFARDWDDALRENVQRESDRASRVRAEIAANAERAEAEQRQHEREALEKQADAWLALEAIRVAMQFDDFASVAAKILVETFAARDKLAAMFPPMIRPAA